ncbi:hypothetical protein V6N13_050608, partial [Hibiscus sabdariffa]
MLGVFSSTIVSPPHELVAAGCRAPSPKTSADALVKRFLETNSSSAVSMQIGDHVQFAYSHHNESALQPRSFGVKDEVFCLFEGALDNLGSLKQEYGLGKPGNEVMLLVEAYKALRDRAPYPPDHMLAHLHGCFSFIVFDHSTSTLFVASDQVGKVPLYWGITADEYVAFADDADLLKGACGKSLASFPQGCFFSTTVGELKSYENPKNKITALPAEEEEMWGAKFKVSPMALLRPFSSSLPFLQPPKPSIIPSNCSISNPHISVTFRIAFPSLTHHPICCSSSNFQSESSTSPSTGVFIKGLPLSTAEGRLKKVFSQFGEVKHVNVVREKVSKQSLGSAFVWFEKEESAQLAVNEMNGK